MQSPKTVFPTQKTHLHIFTQSKSSSPPNHTTNSTSSSSLNSMKIKTLIHNLFFSHICRLIRSLSKLKSILVELCHEARVLYLPDSSSELARRKKKMNKYKKKILFGSFRLHYNWCSSSHVLPINYNYYSSSTPVLKTEDAGDDSASGAHLYYDSTWNSVFSTDGNDCYNQCFDENGGEATNCDDGSAQLSSYLEWLEEKGKKKNESDGNNEEDDEFGKEMNEIDKLADMFIANCHEKFRLEKIESYRRYQEMLARSM